MRLPTNPDVGELIHDYVRAKSSQANSTAKLAGRIDPELRKRIDLLGIDDLRLLEVSPGEVISWIDELERQAIAEDAAVRGGVSNANRSFDLRTPRRHS